MKIQTFKALLLIALTILSGLLTEVLVLGQNTVEPTESHYVFPKFLKANVKMKNGHRESKVMNYNMITEEMVYDQSGTMMALGGIGAIDTIYFETRKF